MAPLALAVRVTLPPAQNVVGPPALTVGVLHAAGLIVVDALALLFAEFGSLSTAVTVAVLVKVPALVMAKAPASDVPLTGPLASRRPSTQISIVLPRFTPATWCQAPSKTFVVETTLPLAALSKENEALVVLVVPRPYCCVEAVA